MIAVGVGTPYFNVVENAVPANPQALTPATDNVPPTNVASYLICILELSELVARIVVPVGRVHLNFAEVVCVVVGVGLTTAYVIVSFMHGEKLPVLEVIEVGVGTTVAILI